MDNLKKIKYDMSNRIIKNPVFDNYDKSLKLSDIVILYNDGMHWKAVPHNIMLSYPVIHDTFENNKKITVYVCPFTLFSCVYFGEFYPTNNIYNGNLVLNDNGKIIIPIKDMHIKKNEVKIMSLRNAISMFPDILFINKDKIEIKEKILVDDYIEKKINKYQPKQIIYIIEYYSKKSDKFKYTVIVPKNNVFDIVKNKFSSYFNNMIDKIRDKGGHIYPCYWFAWQITQSDFKTVEI
ncbi:hypothetical protein Indivirus_1_177 [Indivirus ILV1]|uniref:Uncharacterized protein n=1 Tax=Indivirus ILV1 TaxID=1977633 RepID=A0A1V0SD44_9VIRU|nr:hypothetical protein Indivirus_1_177 [Indivirus ILV1]